MRVRPCCYQGSPEHGGFVWKVTSQRALYSPCRRVYVCLGYMYWQPKFERFYVEAGYGGLLCSIMLVLGLVGLTAL